MKTSSKNLSMKILLLAVGIFLISFGGGRLNEGTGGIAESITLFACIASGVSLLIALAIDGWKAIDHKE